MVNLHTKFEVSMFIHYEDMKGNAKSRNRGGLGGLERGLGVTQRHRQYPHSVERI